MRNADGMPMSTVMIGEDMEGTIGVGVGVRGEVFFVVGVQREFGFVLVGRRGDGDDTGNVAGLTRLSDGEGGTYVVDGNDGVEYKICISVSSSKRPILSPLSE